MGFAGRLLRSASLRTRFLINAPGPCSGDLEEGHEYRNADEPDLGVGGMMMPVMNGSMCP